MKEQVISFKTAKLAKEKGFELNSCSYYELISKGQLRWKFVSEEDDLGTWVNEDSKNRIAAFSQTLLQKWLRKKHNIYVWVELVLKSMPEYEAYKNYNFVFHILDKNDDSFESGAIKGHGWEDTMEAGLQDALNLIL